MQASDVRRLRLITFHGLSRCRRTSRPTWQACITHPHPPVWGSHARHTARAEPVPGRQHSARCRSSLLSIAPSRPPPPDAPGSERASDGGARSVRVPACRTEAAPPLKVRRRRSAGHTEPVVRVQLALAQAVHAPPVGPGLVGGTAIFEKSWPDDHGELRKSNPAVSRWAATLAGIRPSRLQGLWYPSQRLRSPGESRLVTSASLWRAVARPAVRARETSPRQPLVPVLVPYGYGQVAYCAL